MDPGTEVARTVERAGAGATVDPEDADALHRALVALLDDDEGRAEMGRSARRFVESWASPAAVAAAYESLFDRLVAERGRHPVGLSPVRSRGPI